MCIPTYTFQVYSISALSKYYERELLKKYLDFGIVMANHFYETNFTHFVIVVQLQVVVYSSSFVVSAAAVGEYVT